MSDVTSFEQTDEVTSRIGVYRLLSQLWIREIDEDLLEQLHAPELRDHLGTAGIELPTATRETVESLAIDYCQLFVGPSQHLPPFQSVWQGGQFHGRTTALMQKYIDVTGYVVDKSLSDIYLDHLGVQCDVMAHILAVRLSTQGDQQDAVREIENSFLPAHLSWPSPLFKAAAQKATTGFYQTFVAFTRDFLESEMARVEA